jgi:hypothetical protein
VSSLSGSSHVKYQQLDLTDFSHSITKDVVGERFGPNRKEANDMLGSFIHHGLNQEEAESETVLQM